MALDPQIFEIDPTMPSGDLRFVVYGDRMCCASPAGKPNNFTLPFLTPTAAKGMIDAVFHDLITVEGSRFPAFRSCPIRITALEHPDPKLRSAQGQFATLKLNGVAERMRLLPTEQHRIQRLVTYMVAPAFLVDFRVILLPVWKLREEQSKTLETYLSILTRRITKRQSYKRLFFGQNMFPASIKPHENEAPKTDINASLGTLVYDYVFDENSNTPTACRMFDAEVRDGVLDCNWFDGRISLKLDRRPRKEI